MKVVFFNHKGGVSKTTTTYNLGWMLGRLDKKVLIVDADPQCNLTNLILGDNFDEYYIGDTKNNNIMDGVKVAFEGKPAPIQATDCFSPKENPNLFLLAGHPNLSEYDTSLSFAQNSNNAIATLQNLPGAFNYLIEQIVEKYNIDFVLIDLNPGLSAMNQNLFLLSDGFIIPTNPDPFSMMALNFLSSKLPNWVEWLERIRPLFADSSYPLPQSKPKFIGEIIQRFNVRKGKATLQASIPIDKIKTLITDTFIPSMAKHGMLFPEDVYEEAKVPSDFCISEIRDFQGMIHKSYYIGKPVFDLTDEEIKMPIEDGAPTVGKLLENYKKMRDDFASDFDKIAKQLIVFKKYADCN
jgi:cellulose biosynthesis protein BcsQ